MDAFYASVEQRDRPELRKKPVAVGGSSIRGVVAAASYEARAFGVRSAMPSRIALAKCPHLVFVKPRFEVYRDVSRQIRQIFYEYTNLVEPLSLDEAYLDVSSNKKKTPSATIIAREIKDRILKETGLTASAGISVNKFLAKTASDVNKPDGLFVIPPEKVMGFIEKLPIENFFGVGKITAQKMHDMGIRNGYDLRQYSEAELVKRFGKTGHYYYEIAHGEDHREVNPNRIRKSIGAENTFPEDLQDKEEVIRELDNIMNTLMSRINKSQTKGKTLTVKVKYTDFQQITRSKTMPGWIHDMNDYRALYLELIEEVDLREGIRLLGLTLSHLCQGISGNDHDASGVQLTLNF